MKIYRFEKYEEERCEAIADNKLWLSAPSEFNDLDDCRLKGLYKAPLTEEECEVIFNAISLFYPPDTDYREKILTKEIIDSLKKFIKPLDGNHLTLKERLRSAGVVAVIRNELVSTTGVCCFFSGDSDNALMWAHYANSHKGFCVEYELNQESDLDLFYEVTYASDLPMPSATELIFSPAETLTRILTTKSIHWYHEKEWRAIELNALSPQEKGKYIERPDQLKPINIIRGAKFDKKICQ